MESNESERGDRINIDDAVMDIYRELTDNESKEQAPFSTYRDLFLLAACVGLQNKRRTPLSNRRGTAIRQDVFGEQGLAILKAIAIAATLSLEVCVGKFISETITVEKGIISNNSVVDGPFGGTSQHIP